MESMRFQRRQRTTFSQQQIKILNEAFKHNHYPETQQRDYLAKKTNLDPSRIQVWFQNQRAKDRKKRGSTSGDEFKASIDILAPSPLDGTTIVLNHNKQPEQGFRAQQDRAYLNNSSSFYVHSAQSISRFDANEEFKSHSRPLNNRIAACDENYQESETPDICEQPKKVYIFNSSLANEAAKAISQGRCNSLIEYHRLMYRYLEEPTPPIKSDDFNIDSLLSA